MNIKFILIIAVIAGLVHFVMQESKPETKLDILMKESNAEYEGGIFPSRKREGAGFDVNSLAEKGNVTVVEFYTDKCVGCIRLHQHFKRFLSVRSDVIVKQVHMPDDWSVRWAEGQFNLSINSTPHIYIFDALGNVVANDDGNDKAGFKFLYEWMNAELRKAPR